MTKLQRMGMCLAFCSLSACEVWLDVEAPQCKSNKDCVGLFGREFTCATGGVCVGLDQTDAGMKRNLPTRWACADDNLGDFIDDPDSMITIRMDAVDLTTLKVPEGITAAACGPTDFDCKNPLVSDIKPGADGFFAFEVNYGFEGLLKFVAPGIVTGVSMANRPYLESTTTSGPALLTIDAQADLSEHAGHPTEPGTAIAILEIRDCANMAGNGVSFDSVQDQEPFYFDGALPARTLTSTAISNLLGAGREARAVAGFSNLPPGFVSFTGRIASSQEQIARVTIPLFASTITYVRIHAGY